MRAKTIILIISFLMHGIALVILGFLFTHRDGKYPVLNGLCLALFVIAIIIEGAILGPGD